ncbi:MAG: Asp23/Gls24 family envelope stress response protein [Acetobacteraceae bacterium]|nr:Asp23/Gls24 family envelope stress response protein [Acetobacteraceae bacterium]
MAKEIANELGRLVLTEEVIATIAGVAATECYGIVGMASRRLKDGLAELLGRESLSKGVEVTLDGDRVLIDLFIIVGYGVRIREVCHNVAEKVRYAVESMTGLPVSRVRINVQGVRVSPH